ncbi:helix-turn-helix domain-containing protein [Streptococcus suis]|uniref:helix-turn-helix domain-containing protein n=1 Tax=Streptococcus suis TaxID=1307 RepID=UPI0004162B79|nr:helix-turn-helix transcriptional regulator [Streptococcus suis]HEM3178755.1 helix-turn-helix transcriptional regulator [Streptococcus suis 92-4172]
MLKEKLKHARKKAGLTQKEIAERMNITQQQYGLWETGKRTPNDENLKHLANALHTTTDALKGRDDGLEDIIDTLRKYDLTDEDKAHFCQYIDDYFNSKR